MKTGDLVRFPFVGDNLRPTPVFPSAKGVSFPGQCMVVGLLVEYHTWEKIANVLFNGRIHRIHVQPVELHKRL